MNRYLMSVAAHDLSEAMDKLFADQFERHAWLFEAVVKIRKERRNERTR